MYPKAWIKGISDGSRWLILAYYAERELTELEERQLVPDAGVLKESCCVIKVEDYEY